MTPRIAIIGSGPTGIYTLQGLLRSTRPLSITVFEVEADPGKGTPYHPDINDQAMLANIASIELPPVLESLTDWLRRQADADLQRLGVLRANIREREFYPRVILGAYFEAQFNQLLERGSASGHAVVVRPRHRVTDIKLQSTDILLSVHSDAEQKEYAFDHVVMATGHNWPETTETKPGYFISPWPAPALKSIAACPVGILGTSLSAIDALVSVATAHGTFYLDEAGLLQYRCSPENDAFRVTMMSRKGVLPEADFYCEFPYTPLRHCTNAAVDALVELGPANLLDQVFDLFKLELTDADPTYAAKIGLALLNADTFAAAYFSERENADPFVWAATNLAEAEQNKRNQYVVPWRYAILRMHEVFARAIPYFNDRDLRRFQKSFKAVFVDDYATVPHQSVQRILALRRAGRLDILKLGKDYKITDGQPRGAIVQHNGNRVSFDAFIDATGQAAMSARDIPFPSLIEQNVFKSAATAEFSRVITDISEERYVRTGGVDLDSAFRPKFEANYCNQLYCAAISFLLHKLPFVQGITSAHQIGGTVSHAILGIVDRAGGISHPAILMPNDPALT